MQQKTTSLRRSSWWKSLAFLGVFLTVAVGSMISETEARPRILRPGTHDKVYQFGIGPTIYVAGSGGVVGHISNLIGGHFSGDSSGFAFGGSFDLTFAPGLVEFIAAARLWYDIPIARMAIYVSPFIQPGLIIGTSGGFFLMGLDIQFGVEGKVILNNRLLLSLRPIAFDLQIVGISTGFGSGVNAVFGIQFMHFGIGVTF